MKAAVLRDFGLPLELADVPIPEPGRNELLIKVEACGVCHSDLHLAEGDWDLLRPHTRLPVILGHEVAGTVVQLGPETSGFSPGDRVGVPGSTGPAENANGVALATRPYAPGSR